MATPKQGCSECGRYRAAIERATNDHAWGLVQLFQTDYEQHLTGHAAVDVTDWVPNDASYERVFETSIWVTKDGRQIPLMELTDSHLKNIIEWTNERVKDLDRNRDLLVSYVQSHLYYDNMIHKAEIRRLESDLEQTRNTLTTMVLLREYRETTDTHVKAPIPGLHIGGLSYFEKIRGRSH